MTAPTTARSAAPQSLTAPGDRGGVGDSPLRAGRHPQGHRRVRLLQRPVDGRHDLGRHPAQPAPLRPDRSDRHRRGARDPRRATPCSPPTTCPGQNALRAGARSTSRCSPIDVGALPGRAGRAGRRRPPRDRPPGGEEDRVDYERAASRSPTRGARAATRRSAAASTPRRATWSGTCKIRTGEPGARPPTVVVSGEYEVGMQDQAFLGPESGLAVPGRGRRRRPVRRDAVAARRPAPGLRGARPAAGEGAADAGRCRRRVRRPRGPVDARARLPAGAAHRQAGEDGLQPRGVVLRPRAPAPRDDALRARRRPRRHGWSTSRPRSTSTAARTRPAPRRWSGNAGTMGIGPYDVPNVHDRRATASTPTTRRAARCAASARCRPRSRTRRRWTSWPPSSGMDPVELRVPQRACTRASEAPTGQVVDSAGPGRRAAARRAGDAAAAGRGRTARSRDLRAMPGGVVQHHPRRGRPPRRRLRGRLQERRVLRGLRRLLHRPGAAGGARRRGRSRPCTPRRPRSGQGLVTVEQQICRTELGVDQVVVAPQGHPGRLGRVDVGVPADLRDRRRGQGRLRGGPRPRARPGPPPGSAATLPDAAAGRRQGRRRTGDGGDRRWPTCSATRRSSETVEWRHRPTAADRPGDRAGRRARAVRLRRAPRRRRRRHRARAWSRWSSWPAPRTSARRSTRRRWSGRSRAAAAQGLGLALMEEIQIVPTGKITEPVVHRLPDPDHPRHAADADRRARVRRPARAVRPARGRRAADDLLRARRSRPRSGRPPGCRCAGCRSGPSTSPAPDPTRPAGPVGRAFPAGP